LVQVSPHVVAETDFDLSDLQLGGTLGYCD